MSFLLAEIFLAIGVSLVSGANAAILYDTLRDLKQTDRYKKIWGNLLFYNGITLGLSGILGAFVGKINLRWTMYMMIPPILLSLPVALSLVEPKRHKRIIQSNYTKELFIIFKKVFQKRKLKWIILYSTVLIGFNQAGLQIYQPYFTLTGLDILYFGLVYASFQLVFAISSKYSHIIEDVLGKKLSFILPFIIVSVGYFLMSKILFLFSFVFVFFHQFVRGFVRPFISDQINRLTQSNIRATVLSIENVMKSLSYALIIPFVGLIADVYSLVQALFVLGITVLVLSIPTLFFMKKAKVF